MRNDDVEKILRRAFQRNDQSQIEKIDESKCLPNDIIQAFCEGRLPDDRQEEVQEHLLECPLCRQDLRMYFNLMGGETEEDAGSDQIVLRCNDQEIKFEHNWLVKGRSLEIRGIQTPGTYDITIGLEHIKFECTAADLLKPSSPIGRKAAADEEKVLATKEIASDSGEAIVQVIPGKYAAYFSITIKS
jgi:hypothetical protein